jgi:hypothetical protein
MPTHPLDRVPLRSVPPPNTIILPPQSTPLLVRPKISTRLPELAVPPLSVAPEKMIAVATPVGSGPPWSTAAGPTSRTAPGWYITEDENAPSSSSAPGADNGGPGGNTTGFENLQAAGFDRGIRCGASGVRRRE